VRGDFVTAVQTLETHQVALGGHMAVALAWVVGVSAGNATLRMMPAASDS
jgi:hypothetical protein